jgi:hypothetical protein
MGSVSAFKAATSVAIAAGTTSVSVTLPAGGDQALVTNACADYIFVRFGHGTTVALAAPPDAVIAAGQRRIFDVPYTVSTVAVLLNTGTGTVFVERGTGTQY